MIRTLRSPLVALGGLAFCSACSGIQSMTGGDGFQGAQFNRLFTLFMGVACLSYLLVLVFLAAALVRRRRDGTAPQEEHRLNGGLIGWTAAIVIGLTILVIASYVADRNTASAASRPALEIEVTANQWWWDVRYPDRVPSNLIRTANELHLPLGTPARLTLKSNDVIHSFWVPNLAGKQDLIPGRVNDLMLYPKVAGVYRAQCAEFCGAQHAHMALDVIVEPQSAFEAWRQRQRAPAAAPHSPLAIAGYGYVTSRECSVCHSIAGTPASGQVAPDLTHLASRRSIGAGTFPMSRGHLYAWVADPQGAKPGNHMPYVGLDAGELHAVVAYLESLK